MAANRATASKRGIARVTGWIGENWPHARASAAASSHTKKVAGRKSSAAEIAGYK